MLIKIQDLRMCVIEGLEPIYSDNRLHYITYILIINIYRHQLVGNKIDKSYFFILFHARQT